MVVYLDYNATTPVDFEVQSIICSTLKSAWENPSSSYEAGRSAKSVIEEARRKVAEMVSSAPHEIVFTSGGTESNNAVFSTVVENFYEKRKGTEIPHIVTTNIEHDSVKVPLETFLSKKTADVTFVPVSKHTGMVSADDIVHAVRPNTCLISVMLANNETGVIQPVHKLRSKLQIWQRNHPFGVSIHTDAAQALGKVEVDVDSLDVDYLTIVGHKFYGPRIGALYFKHGKPLHSVIYGAGQEKNCRPGTENTCMIAGLGKAAELVTLNLQKYSLHMTAMRTHLEQCLKSHFPSAKIHFRDVDRLPNTVSVALSVNSTATQLLAEAKGLCASTGAACHSGAEVSNTLLASGVTKTQAERTLRLSVGRETTDKQIEEAMTCLSKAVKKLR